MSVYWLLKKTIVAKRKGGSGSGDLVVVGNYIACEEDIAHIVVMPNVRAVQFVAELKESVHRFGRVKLARSDSPLTKLGVAW